MLVGRALALAAAVRLPRHQLPAVRALAADGSSVSGVVYAGPDDKPTVRLFTKAGCTLCDVAKGCLRRFFALRTFIAASHFNAQSTSYTLAG